MESTTIQSVTFKLTYGQEIRRFSVVPRVTTFSQLYQFATEGLPTVSSGGYRLTWRDQENDLIALKTQADLEECLNFVLAGDLNTIKITVEAIASPPPYPTHATEVADVKLQPEEFSANEEVQRLVELELGGGLAVKPKLRKKLEKMNKKFAKKEQKCLSKLAELRQSPHFDEKAFAAQVQLLSDAGIPATHPMLQMCLAERQVKRNKKQAMRERWGCKKSSCCASKKSKCCSSGCLNRWLQGNVSQKTRDQLRLLEEQDLAHGFFVAKVLEVVNSELDPRDAGDVLIGRQLKELDDLTSLPRAFLIHYLRKANRRRSCCIFRSCCSSSN